MSNALLKLHDFIQILYFAIHIPISILVDSQSVFPASYYPQWALDAVKWHINTNKDFLVRDNPLWFVSFVACECFFQLPLQMILLYGLVKKAAWVRIPAIIYGTHVTTTMVPILAELVYGADPWTPTWTSVAIYMPWLILPLALTLRMALCSCSEPSSKSARAKRSKAA